MELVRPARKERWKTERSKQKKMASALGLIVSLRRVRSIVQPSRLTGRSRMLTKVSVSRFCTVYLQSWNGSKEDRKLP